MNVRTVSSQRINRRQANSKLLRVQIHLRSTRLFYYAARTEAANDDMKIRSPPIQFTSVNKTPCRLYHQLSDLEELRLFEKIDAELGL
jgi:hypothetical protein